ncbi:MAG: tRNA uridine-5-carboxymethylaminomethyl(34) synthesis GTPase MnmE [Candidatus Desulfofervidus auxilii]|nr:tRNA uridine-5-carboxymethylaminomethyl(34) synthesis GTPase MnmE [Candidatus Desulfofervidus auxilii]
MFQNNKDTISAIATPPGIGGVGIVRVSGPLAETILKKLFRPKRPIKEFKSHHFYYGEIIHPETKQMVDEVLIVLMRAPHSYTGEDVLEIHAHGGPLILKKILELTLKAGARLAEPGEFTKRAFLNGRLDLTQAEAVLDIISARTEKELQIATRQLQGYLGEKIKKIRDCLKEFKAHLEVAIDFPEEDVEIVPSEVWLPRIENEVLKPIEHLLKCYSESRILREGAILAIVGKPNVGKSSLLNCLLKEERAIVTPIPGTTRDVIEEILNIKGIAVKIADTAGLRKTVDVVETIGVKRAKEKIIESDIVLWVIDRSCPLEEDDREIYEEIKGKKIILVLNKSDLPPKIDEEKIKKEFNLPVISISALYGKGIEKLEEAIYHQLIGDTAAVPEFVPTLRHKQALERALKAGKRVKDAIIKGLPPVFVSVDVQETLDALGEIIGETTPEDILDIIFSQFCIGK